jgi:hypothetical protein
MKLPMSLRVVVGVIGALIVLGVAGNDDRIQENLARTHYTNTPQADEQPMSFAQVVLVAGAGLALVAVAVLSNSPRTIVVPVRPTRKTPKPWEMPGAFSTPAIREQRATRKLNENRLRHQRMPVG